MAEETGFKIKSIRFKFYLAGFFIILLMATIVILTYRLNSQISNETIMIRDIDAPLEIMSEQVIGYDAMLTGYAHAALLNGLQGNIYQVRQYEANYSDIGTKLDNLLNAEAPALINQSNRPASEKDKVYAILKDLNESNIKLVNLEMAGFAAIDAGRPEDAFKYIVSDTYRDYKAELAQDYKEWSAIESQIVLLDRQEVIANSRNIIIYDLILGGLFVILSLIAVLIGSNAIIKPIRELFDATKEIAKGNYKTRVDIKSGDEMQELGESFNKTAEELGRLDEERKQLGMAKTEFLSITSHELRSPMTPMKAQLQMLIGEYYGKLNAKQREAADIVLRNTDRLDRIIVDFLEISRIEAARLKFNFVKTSLSPYLDRLIEEMNAFLPEKKISIILKAEKLPVIEVDPDRVMQILRNLISNAKKFSPDGSKVTIVADRQGDHILFSVRDEGIGIKQEDQNRIFEPFFQAEKTMYRQYSGTGLGLAIAKGIVGAQNGRIWFNSIPGKGTIFYFTIPIVPVREIKPIKILFSDTGEREKKIAAVFNEMLGPVGAGELDNLKKEKGLMKESIDEYIREMAKLGIISREGAVEFKKKAELIMKGKEGVSEEDISKYIKRRE